MTADDGNVFTDHVKQLASGTTEIPDAVRKKLINRLSVVIRKRGLGNCSPAALGYAGTKLSDLEVIEELFNDAYCHLFFGIGKKPGSQLNYLKQQVETGNPIDPLIQHGLNNYVHDLHRKAYPEDKGIYKNLIAAAKALVEDPQTAVVCISDTEVSLDTLLGISGDSPQSVEAFEIEHAIRQADIWHEALGIVTRYSKTATSRTAAGILNTIESGVHPLLLRLMKQVISNLAWEPVEAAVFDTEATFPDEDQNNPEFVRTILDEHRYEIRQEKVTEFVLEGRRAIDALHASPSKTEKLKEILECYAEFCRHADPEKTITQEQVRENVGLKKQTMSDCMKQLRLALETMKP